MQGYLFNVSLCHKEEFFRSRIGEFFGYQFFCSYSCLFKVPSLPRIFIYVCVKKAWFFYVYRQIPNWIIFICRITIRSKLHYLFQLRAGLLMMYLKLVSMMSLEGSFSVILLHFSARYTVQRQMTLHVSCFITLWTLLCM